MKTISIQDLKNSLSAVIDDAASGETVIITKHGQPVARLEPVDGRYLTVGRRFGPSALKPLLKLGRDPRLLAELYKDRKER